MRFGIFSLPTYFPELDGSITEFYQHILQFLQDSEQLGFDCAWVNEHHFHPYGGMIPAPPVLLAAVAARTTRIRLGTSVALLPLHHPLQTAEAYAMLDQLSGGRLELGVGRGFMKFDYDTFGVPWEEGQDRLYEYLDIVRAAWQHQPFSYTGRFYTFREVSVWPRPCQTPHPPIWGAASRTPSSFAWWGSHGYDLLTVAQHFPLEHLADLLRVYREAAAASGYDPATLKVSTHYQVYCCESRAEAYRDGAAAIERYRTQILEALPRGRTVFTPPPHVPFEELVEQARVCIGTPDDCVAILKRARDTLGLTGVDCTFYFGGLEYTKARRSFELFAREVIPRLRAQPAMARASA
ncbi:MAG TPA: LLM class flavin-dependent oxidoreductase [Chloroflexota bacterium]|nr:LLM class flavin-dependent oxidoreductase [Chloroflexota bacterium]HZU06694.1 LLM class flavin-dependent oxidoreductase [Chloroflexota bacterium]